MSHSLISLYRSLLLASALFALLPHRAGAVEEIKMWVSTSSKAEIFDRIKEPLERQTGVRIVYAGDTLNTGSNIYFTDLVANKVEASTTSLDYDEWVKNMRKQGVEVPKDITFRVIGGNTLSVFANPKLGIAKLSLEQLNDLFTGKIANWKVLGGPDQNVVPVYAHTKQSSFTTFRKVVMKGAEFSPQVHTQNESFEGVVATVAKTPGAIGFTSSAVRNQGATKVDIPTIGRPITLITRGKPSEKLQKVLEFIHKEGKKYGIGTH